MTTENIKKAEKQLNEFLDFLETRYYVTLELRRGAYGAGYLVLKDREADEEADFYRD